MDGDLTVSGAVSDGSWPSARWNEALGDPVTLRVITSRVAEGETLREVCKSRGWPYSLVARWLSEDDGRRAEYEWSLRLWADAVAQECVTIADTTQLGAIRKTDADGGVTVTEEDMLAHRKLQIETRMRLAARWDRERYGERSAVDVKHGGNITVTVARFADERPPEAFGSHLEVTPVPGLTAEDAAE